MCLYALHFVHDTDTAEDIVQESFAKMWSILQEGRQILNTRAYLYSVVKSEALSVIKQQRLMGLSTPLVDASIDYEELERSSFTEARLWTAIDSLPARCREIFLMSKRDGMKYSEIAAELNISPKTVENQISKALHTLKNGAIKIYNFFFA